MAKNKLLPLLFCFILLGSFVQKQADKKDSPLLRHVVMFQFTEKATAAEIRKVADAFRALPEKIKEIKGFEWGVNNSPEKLNQGMTHCFFLTFESEKDRDAYLVHPAHKAFGDLLKPIFEKATVLDYWVHK
ncbi:MAG: hypothetical protein RLZZ28_1366 [Bacteroidota bacterium]|jgi:hypothetical protein